VLAVFLDSDIIAPENRIVRKAAVQNSRICTNKGT